MSCDQFIHCRRLRKVVGLRLMSLQEMYSLANVGRDTMVLVRPMSTSFTEFIFSDNIYSWRCRVQNQGQIRELLRHFRNQKCVLYFSAVNFTSSSFLAQETEEIRKEVLNSLNSRQMVADLSSCVLMEGQFKQIYTMNESDILKICGLQIPVNLEDFASDCLFAV